MTGNIIIIGGGITGCAAAWHLARAGKRVRLLESLEIASMASGWTLGGVRQSGRDPAELPMAKVAVDLWPRLSEILGYETGYARHGNLRLARNESEIGTIRLMVEQQKSMGLDLAFLPDNRAIRAIAPAISAEVPAASFCATDGFADPVAATKAFARAARDLGAEIVEGVRVTSIIRSNGRVAGVETSGGFLTADCVIVAAGTHTPGLLAPLGLFMPMEVTLVQVVLSEPVEHRFDQVFGVANADCAGRQEPGGRFRITNGISAYQGDAENWSEALLRPTPEDAALLRQRVSSLLPMVAEAAVSKTWGGLIDLTPDGLPVIDAPDSVPGLVVAAGFSGHGFGIGPISGRLTAEIAMGLEPFLDTGAFRLARLLQRPVAQAPLSLHG